MCFKELCELLLDRIVLRIAQMHTVIEADEIDVVTLFKSLDKRFEYGHRIQIGDEVIIMPLYNGEAYVAEAITSVLSQTYPHWELLIVDDGSTDDSYGIAQRYAKEDARIKLFKMPRNSGAAEARNLATQKATGEYIAFLDSDDIWLAEKLQAQIDLMEKEQVRLCYASYDAIDQEGKKVGFYKAKPLTTYKEMLRTSTIGTLTMVYHAKTLGKYYFPTVGHEDYIVKLKILKKIPYAKGVERSLAQYRISAQSLSGNKFKAALWQWHIYREVEHLSLPKSLFYFVQYVYFGVRKYK